MAFVVHPKWRCDTCEFWAHGDQRGKDHDANWHADDKIGSCRRNAPSSTHGDFEYEVLHLLSMVAWASADWDEEEFKHWEEATIGHSQWPETIGSDWCGEWRERTSMEGGYCE